MTKLNDLRPPSGANEGSDRRGRGPGSGSGKTAGRGHKGQKARSGDKQRPWFEGGQMPLLRRVPKRGFTNVFRTECEIVNLGDLHRVVEDVITPEVLHQYGLINLNKNRPVKILGDGDVDRELTVRVHRVSASARSKIEAAGGTIELRES